MVGRWCPRSIHLSHFHCARGLPPRTRTYVRLLGPCFKTGCREPFRQHLPSQRLKMAPAKPKRSQAIQNRTRLTRATQLASNCNMHAHTGCLRFLLSNFRYYLTLFSKFFASFPHGTCSLSVSHRYLALDGIYHPLRAAIPSNSTRRKHTVRGSPEHRRDCHPLMMSLFQGTLSRRPRWRGLLFRLQFTRRIYSHGLFPLQSPLLRESWLVSFPPLSYMLKFSGSSCLIGDPIK